MQDDTRRVGREMTAGPGERRAGFGRIELLEHEERLLGMSPPRFMAGKQAGKGLDVQ